MWKAKAKVHRKGGMPRFTPTDEERGLVQLLSGVGYSQDRIARYISNSRGASISTKTLQRVFRTEIEIGQTSIDKMAYACLVAKIKAGDLNASRMWLEQKCWQVERGNWRARPQPLEISSARSEADGGSGLPPVQLIVEFVASDPSMRPILR
jgi:hypothetical protein